MYDFVMSGLGWFHLISAILAMMAGAIVLIKPKGTRLHRRFGYVYVMLMILVNLSALGIYNLSGRFGVFHVLALVSLATIFAGMIPLMMNRLQTGNKTLHLWFMYYSVLGLYAAFASELSVRIPEKPFFLMVGIASGFIFLSGTAFILWKEKQWRKYFLEKD